MNAELMAEALAEIRKAAGGAKHFTNRLQYIHERAGRALAGEPWDASWRAQYGYDVRNRVLLENDALRARIAALEAQHAAA